MSFVTKLGILLLGAGAFSFTSASPIGCPEVCSVPAYTFSSALTTSDPDPLSFGFQFSTNQAVTVSALGYYDAGGDGLAVSHNVGLFDSVGTLLVSATVNAGTMEPLIDNFRYVSISPLSLTAGALYTIAATTGGGGDSFAYGVIGSTISGFSTISPVQIGSNAGTFVYTSEGLVFPTEQFGYSLYAGPNFLTGPCDVAQTPEPAPAALLGSSLTGLLLARRWKHCTAPKPPQAG
jgi:hypothetical protein